MPDDRYFVSKTLELAKKGEGRTSPNPMVGAVITRGARVISSGFHRKSGLAHAEAAAIARAKENLSGTTLYVNLEPCCHWGKTPPCCDLIIKSGISRVVIACRDPNPLVSGKSIRKLRKAGISVTAGVLKDKSEKLNEVFFTNMKKSRPFIAVKAAQSLDGKIACARGDSKWITGNSARAASKKIRDKYDAVLVGINTIINDNPTLRGASMNPVKIIIDPELKIPLKSKIVANADNDLLIVASPESGNKLDKIRRIEKKGGIIWIKRKNGVIDPMEIISRAYGEKITSIFVEGGGMTIGRFFDAGCVDKVYFFVAPKIIGGEKNLSSVSGRGVDKVSRACRLRDVTVGKIGPDFLFTGYPCFT